MDSPTMLGLIPSKEAILMIDPSPRTPMTRPAARLAKKVPHRLVRNTESSRSGVTSCRVRVG